MNCIIVDDEAISRNIMTQLVAQIPFLNLCNVCINAKEALTILNNSQIDLMLLDVEMPDISGLDLIKSLTIHPLTILATSKKEYAIEAFECNVVDYIVKPVSLDRFLKAIVKAKEIFDASQQTSTSFGNDFVFIKVNGNLIKIDVKEILWMEALGDYVTINTSETKYTIHSTMKSIEKKLPPQNFIRVHRSFIVSLNNIDSIDDRVIVINKQLIPIGAIYKEKLIQKLNLL